MTSAEPSPASPIIHYDSTNKPPVPQRPYTNPNLLSPDAAYYSQSPPARLPPPEPEHFSQEDRDTVDRDTLSLGRGSRSRRRRRRDGSRRGKAVWRKLLWVKQRDYPDNYTDPPTFLAHMRRNLRLRPYDFWPLVADSTVIVQHLSSIVIFVCSFVAINKGRISPISVVSWGTAGTVLGWILWDIWLGQERVPRRAPEGSTTLPNGIVNGNGDFVNGSAITSNPNSPTNATTPTPSGPSTNTSSVGLGLTLSSTNLSVHVLGKGHQHSASQGSISSVGPSPTLSHHPSNTGLRENAISASAALPLYYSRDRMHQRLSTAKSALLIYTALLGLSPILKSLTQSTSSDSIWALSTWLMLLHILFFDYGSGGGSPSTETSSSSSSRAHPNSNNPSTTATAGTGTGTGTATTGAKFPASLSTNAALMASTVLASRLPSTTHVFSLMLFSIEVFGLFPVWRRCLRHLSWRGHLTLTSLLVIGAGASLGLIISDRRVWSQGGWKRALAGSVVWTLACAVGMGGCSWWLIGLQHYKDVVSGPWDPARPVLSRGGGGAASWD